MGTHYSIHGSFEGSIKRNWFTVSLPDAVPDKKVVGIQIQNRRDCCQNKLVGTHVYLIDGAEKEIYCGTIGFEGHNMDVNFSFTGACAGPVTGKTLKLLGLTSTTNTFENKPFYSIMNFNEIRL